MMKAVWITPKEMRSQNVIYRFEKTITASKSSDIELNISADTRYKLYFNGEYICEGPCQSDHWFWRYETVKIPSSIIKDGENVIRADVLYLAEETYFTQAKRERAALLVFGKCVTDGKTEEINTDGGWGCKIVTSMMFVDSHKNCSAVMSNIPPMALYTLDEDVNVGARPYKQCWHEVGNHTPYGLADDYRLAKRSIKLITPEPPKPFTELVRTETTCELDAGVYTTAFACFKFKGKRGEKIRFYYAESYTDENGSKEGVRRDKPNAKITGVYDEITFTGEMQSYESYFYKAFRYVKAEYPAGTEFVASEQAYKPYFYPVEGAGTVRSDKAIMNKLWEISVNTLKCCTHETFVDCPYYEQCQYDMDTAIEMMVMMRLTDDYSMPKKAVYDLARSQQPDGMLCAHYPTSWVQIIPNFSLFWILMLRDYVTYSGDIDAAHELLPVADRVLNCFERLKTDKGIVGNTPYWHYTDWVPGWKRGIPPMGDSKPLTTASMMYACALGVAATLADEVGRSALAGEYRTRKSEMIKAINENLYDSDKEFYVDVYGERTYSEHTAVWAVLSDCVVGDKAVELLDRSFATDVSRASFSFNYYTFRALEKAGIYAKYSERLFGGWYKMVDWGCTTWCENPDAPRSECHAWSSAPVYEYSAMVLGVKPIKTGFEAVEIIPDLSYADKIEGSVPTPHGLINVAWEKRDGKYYVTADVPTKIKAIIVLGGKRYDVNGSFKVELDQ